MAQATAVVTTTGTLTDDQLASIARQAGFPENEIPTAVAVARAESSGNPRAHNTKPPDNSYGLWQVNMYGQLGPDRRKAFGITNNDALFDPAVNARAAYQIWKQQGWKGWSTFNNGSYRKFLNQASGDADTATAGIGTLVGGPIGGPAIDAVLNNRFSEFTEKFRLASITYLVFLVALVLLILGVVILNRQAIASVIPAGRVAKIAKGLT